MGKIAVPYRKVPDFAHFIKRRQSPDGLILVQDGLRRWHIDLSSFAFRVEANHVHVLFPLLDPPIGFHLVWRGRKAKVVMAVHGDCAAGGGEMVGLFLNRAIGHDWRCDIGAYVVFSRMDAGGGDAKGETAKHSAQEYGDIDARSRNDPHVFILSC